MHDARERIPLMAQASLLQDDLHIGLDSILHATECDNRPVSRVNPIEAYIHMVA
jgi:hypothetical protein